MTPKQTLFIKEYLVDLNATQAAIRAGYSKKTAGRIGQENVSKPVIAEAIEVAKSARAVKVDASAERVVRELAAIGFADPREMFSKDGQLLPVHALPDHVAAAVQSIEVIEKMGEPDEEGNRPTLRFHKIRLWNKPGALEQLGKHLGMFLERHEIVGKGGGPLQIADMTNIELARQLAFVLAKGAEEPDDRNA